MHIIDKHCRRSHTPSELRLERTTAKADETDVGRHITVICYCLRMSLAYARWVTALNRADQAKDLSVSVY